MKNKVVVVGGGIAGIFSALMYGKKGYEVILVEKADEIGGLLRSRELFEDGLFYDYGTHILVQMGVEEIDELLFSNVETDVFDYLKSGSFFKKLFEGNSFLSDKYLETREQCFEDLLKIEPKESYSNLKEQLEGNFGRGYANDLLSPVVKKLFFSEPEELVENCHGLFGLTRIVVADSKTTNELKKQTKFDNVIGYHSFTEGIPTLKNMYPTEGGVGSWIEGMKKTLKSFNVQVVTNAEIGDIQINNKKITSVEINETTHEIDTLVWTAPPFFLLSKAGIKVQSSGPPKRLTSCIFHFLVDEEYKTDTYYFHCYDPDFKTFRVTLYDNYSKGIKGKYRVTVEVLLDSVPDDLDTLQNEVFDELIKMSVFSENVTILNKSHNIYPNGFPVLTKSFMESVKLQNEAINNNLTNVQVFGKSKGSTWFMNHIIHDIYNELKD